jgi:hypothetical protein
MLNRFSIPAKENLVSITTIGKGNSIKTALIEDVVLITTIETPRT